MPPTAPGRLGPAHHGKVLPAALTPFSATGDSVRTCPEHPDTGADNWAAQDGDLRPGIAVTPEILV